MAIIVQGKVIGGAQTKSIAAGGTYILGAGVWYVKLGANTVLEIQGEGDGTWTQIGSAGFAGLVFSDGAYVRFRNGGVAAENSTIWFVAQDI